MNPTATVGFSDSDRAELHAALRAALDDLCPPQKVRADVQSAEGWDRALWRRLCTEVGLAGLGVPVDLGGAGGGLAEVGTAFEEAGAALLCAPLLSTVALALPQLLGSGDRTAIADYVPAILSGELVATVAAADLAGAHPPAARVRATSGPGGWRLDGAAGHVVDATAADLILVPAWTEDRMACFAVERGADGLRVENLTTLDLTRRQAHLHFKATPARLIGSLGAEDAVARGFAQARALLACEMAGGSAHVLDMTVTYVKQRVQFGRPIGSFQAVKQKCADLLIAVESSRSAARHAAAADPAELVVAAAVAHAFCGEAYRTVTAAAIQLHGGIGFTWEHDLHLYFKRARASAVMLGTESQDLDIVASHLERSAS
ncbi:acyl-CoA dehydrogenase [Humibacter sp.]|uniref:acyl-CoA dehydrogenase family protein n=1 Tax=Humibacter sp. TaxID=1940291 RepID=UPI002CE3E4A3|nr:acyl-CoA dehydrogenase [Humibacter sp.]HVX09163.1 acyl-CoA dehydrogenase [Humibacter sp.]